MTRRMMTRRNMFYIHAELNELIFRGKKLSVPYARSWCDWGHDTTPTVLFSSAKCANISYCRWKRKKICIAWRSFLWCCYNRIRTYTQSAVSKQSNWPFLCTLEVRLRSRHDSNGPLLISEMCQYFLLPLKEKRNMHCVTFIFVVLL